MEAREEGVMIREQIAKGLDHDPNFRWRGEAVTRIENLSDIIFALTLSLYVSSVSPPGIYAELWPHLLTIFPVAAGFAMLLSVWNEHFTFFRRYGVADATIIFINALLLLVILFIAYPLRFAFDSLFAFILGMMGDWRMMDELGISTYRQAGEIIAVVSVGLMIIYCLYHWMYQHALKKADLLELSLSEVAITRRSIWKYRFQVMINALVTYLAVFTIIGPFAAFLGILNWPAAVIIEGRITLPSDPKSTPE